MFGSISIRDKLLIREYTGYIEDDVQIITNLTAELKTQNQYILVQKDYIETCMRDTEQWKYLCQQCMEQYVPCPDVPDAGSPGGGTK